MVKRYRGPKSSAVAYGNNLSGTVSHNFKRINIMLYCRYFLETSQLSVLFFFQIFCHKVPYFS